MKSLETTTVYDNNNFLLQSNMLVTPYATKDATTSPLSNDENYNNENDTLPSTSLTFSPSKKNVSKRRSQVKNACVNCQKACKKCDEGRPCQRCIKLGITDTCFNSPRKERKKGFKRGPYRKKSTTSQPNISPKKDVQDVMSPLFTTTIIKKEQKPTSLTIITTVSSSSSSSSLSSPPVNSDSTLYAVNPVDYDFPTTSKFNHSFDETSLQTQFMTSTNNYTTTPPTSSYYNNSTIISNNISYQPYQPYQNSSSEYYYPNNNTYYDNTTTSSSPEDSFTASLPNWSYTDLIENPLYNHTQNASPFVPKLGDNALITPNNKRQNYEINNKYDLVDGNNTTIFNDQQWLTNGGALEMHYYPSNVMY
ncbi:hypothetical protein EDC94DRAFT_651310 [Helicostylum pulchrum]|nr:hypothetical protein EDC94DRAFT_651310 [Helicostylum pulchrum]